jgi:hypothetical protein
MHPKPRAASHQTIPHILRRLISPTALSFLQHRMTLVPLKSPSYSRHWDGDGVDGRENDEKSLEARKDGGGTWMERTVDDRSLSTSSGTDRIF